MATYITRTGAKETIADEYQQSPELLIEGVDFTYNSVTKSCKPKNDKATSAFRNLQQLYNDCTKSSEFHIAIDGVIGKKTLENIINLLVSVVVPRYYNYSGEKLVADCVRANNTKFLAANAVNLGFILDWVARNMGWRAGGVAVISETNQGSDTSTTPGTSPVTSTTTVTNRSLDPEPKPDLKKSSNKELWIMGGIIGGLAVIGVGIFIYRRNRKH